MKHSYALKLAGALVGLLQPASKRIEIVGSVRRGKPEVKDIEILVLPDMTPVSAPVAIFGQPMPMIHKTMLDKILFEWKLKGVIKAIKGGEKYKQFWLMRSLVHVVKVDLFIVTPPAEWGVQSVLRTGPNDDRNNFSQWMVTSKSKGGALPEGYAVSEGCVWRRSGDDSLTDPVPMPEEKDFFKFCGLDFIEPGEREAKWQT